MSDYGPSDLDPLGGLRVEWPREAYPTPTDWTIARALAAGALVGALVSVALWLILRAPI